jgi:hypothetical protein
MNNNTTINTTAAAPLASLGQLTIAAEFYLKELAQLVVASRNGVDMLPDNERDSLYQHLAWVIGLVHFMDGQLSFKTAVALTTGEDVDSIIDRVSNQFTEEIRQMRADVRDSWITHH